MIRYQAITGDPPEVRMNVLILASALISSLSLLAWVWLVVGRGWFWKTDQLLPDSFPASDESFRLLSVSIVVPARNEADVLPLTLPTLLRQDYPGDYHVFLVDDRSKDGTGDVARRIAREGEHEEHLTVIEGKPLPTGWSGKVWALQQGVQASQGSGSEYLLLTDADIAHPHDSLRRLVSWTLSQHLDMASLMVRLRAKTFWERLLVPAFVYFFAKLYPFRWADDYRKPTAAAAGGCVLVRRNSLEASGGLEAIADALIDDCALAHRIKSHTRAQGGRIWIGLTREVRSLREYNGLGPIWNTVARTAYAQLSFSPFVLAGTVAGMLFLYLVPPASAIGGLIAVALDGGMSSVWLTATGFSTWALMAGSYLPMLRWHDTPRLYAPLLPFIGLLYTLMTVDSALRCWRGEGGAWKGRTYGGAGPAKNVTD